MAYLEINHLKYRYPNTSKLAIDDISFSVEQGQFIGIIGENGSGKSTLCLAISGLVPHFYKGAYGGSIMLDHIEIAKTPVSSLCQKVGLVLQNPFNQLSGSTETVFEEVAFGLQNLGCPREEIISRVTEVLELLDILSLKDKNPFDLSGGQMQRVALASVLAMKPEVILLDEPTSQLDPAGSDEVFQAVEKLTKTGITIIMVEQKMEKLAHYCDKLLLMHQGKLIDYQLPDSIFSRDDLYDYGVVAPAYTTLCKQLQITKENGFYPATLEETLLLKPQILDKLNPNTIAEAEHTVNEEKQIFQIDHVSFSYGVQEIIHDLSFSIFQEPTAIIGQNGAGKTTLVKLLKGLLKPITGNIYYFNDSISQKTVAMLAKDIGYVFQNPDEQIFRYQVIDEVMFGPLNIGMSKELAKQKAKEALSFVGLLDRANDNPYDLEMSERKLIAIASVLAMDTQVLILDEPTIAQDHAGKELIGKLILQLQAQGKTVISILHDMDFVAQYFQRIIVMHAGNMIASGNRREIFSQTELLSKAHVEQPYFTRLCQLLGFHGIYFSAEEFHS